MQKKSLFLIIFSFLIISCGPIYKTVYDYQSPRDTESRYCLNTCDTSRQHCSSRCDDRQQNCEVAANSADSMEYASCQMSGKKDCKKPYNYSGHYHCKDHNCKKECTNNYNQCFRNCGGTINTRTVCTFNCP